jgi:hypothetical protein
MMCAGLKPLSRLGCVLEQDRLISPSQTRQSILTLPSHRALLHVRAAFDCSKAGVGGDFCEGRSRPTVQITNLVCAPASCSTEIGCFCKLPTIVRSFDGLPSCVWQGYHSFSCPLRFWPSSVCIPVWCVLFGLHEHDAVSIYRPNTVASAMRRPRRCKMDSEGLSMRCALN